MKTWEVVMNPSMDDRRILAEMERHLAREDPELASLMDALNHQFSDGGDEEAGGDKAPHDWHWKLAIVFAVVAVVGMILTAIFSRQAPPDDNKGPPNGITPAHSVQGRRSTAAGTPMRRRRTSPTATARPADPSYGLEWVFALVWADADDPMSTCRDPGEPGVHHRTRLTGRQDPLNKANIGRLDQFAWSHKGRVPRGHQGPGPRLRRRSRALPRRGRLSDPGLRLAGCRPAWRDRIAAGGTNGLSPGRPFQHPGVPTESGTQAAPLSAICRPERRKTASWPPRGQPHAPGRP
ncbi:DUF3040 domain-containing protein [Streptomyces sp. NPDC045431]|uniref:DUF3040 domain-containing protein n=1 Tax=Streptomyces sp. NPDC045431 TaxID=3155613 RepID=UPI0033FDE86B